MDLNKNGAFVILVIALLAIGAYLYVNSNQSYSNTVSVQGNSEINVKPDLTSLYLSIETLDKNAKDSQTRNTEITNAVIGALKSAGFEDTDIETLNFNVYEDFDWTTNNRVSKGFKTVHNIKLSI